MPRKTTKTTKTAAKTRATRKPAVRKRRRKARQAGSGIASDALQYAKDNKGKLISGAALAALLIASRGYERPRPVNENLNWYIQSQMGTQPNSVLIPDRSLPRRR
jgi:hypothetical protein